MSDQLVWRATKTITHRLVFNAFGAKRRRSLAMTERRAVSLSAAVREWRARMVLSVLSPVIAKLVRQALSALATSHAPPAQSKAR